MAERLSIDGPVPLVLARDPDSSWRDDAACLSAPPELFDPLNLGENYWTPRVKDALRFCTVCPVREACLVDAQANAVSGVRGGRIFYERDSYPVHQVVAEVVGRRHGTPAALRDHRAGGRSCPQCEWHLVGRPRIGRPRLVHPHMPDGRRP